MANVTLGDLITKVRKLTARPNANQISDAQITDYINLFYEYDFPQNLKAFDFHRTYTFITQPNIDTYALSVTDLNLYKSFNPPCYASGFPVCYYQNTEQFFRMYPVLYVSQVYGTATGVAGPYNAVLSSIPILRNSVLISVVQPTGATWTCTDVPAVGLPTGTFAGDATGTINYVTGAISITWNAVPPAGNIMRVKSVPYQASRPLSILFYNNEFTLRPVPDEAYQMTLQAYIKPTAYVSTTLGTNPFLDEYFQMLAYGAACKIFLDSLEMENYQMLRPLLQEQMVLCERKTLMQIKNQRTSTIYSDYPYPNANMFPTI